MNRQSGLPRSRTGTVVSFELRRVADPPGAGRRKPNKSPGDEEAVPCLIKKQGRANHPIGDGKIEVNSADAAAGPLATPRVFPPFKT